MPGIVSTNPPRARNEQGLKGIVPAGADPSAIPLPPSPDKQQQQQQQASPSKHVGGDVNISPSIKAAFRTGAVTPTFGASFRTATRDSLESNNSSYADGDGHLGIALNMMDATAFSVFSATTAIRRSSESSPTKSPSSRSPTRPISRSSVAGPVHEQPELGLQQLATHRSESAAPSGRASPAVPTPAPAAQPAPAAAPSQTAKNANPAAAPSASGSLNGSGELKPLGPRRSRAASMQSELNLAGLDLAAMVDTAAADAVGDTAGDDTEQAFLARVIGWFTHPIVYVLGSVVHIQWDATQIAAEVLLRFSVVRELLRAILAPPGTRAYAVLFRALELQLGATIGLVAFAAIAVGSIPLYLTFLAVFALPRGVVRSLLRRGRGNGHHGHGHGWQQSPRHHSHPQRHAARGTVRAKKTL
ncbi:hypothetical protein H9P43_001413 [Blastocladiella emersonii ATCC 22665]|nr:hypothetical protein H9P43_001413 [Blastocladiella emersonii ATCC 22665]